MVSITVLELHLEDASFSADSPFSRITGTESDDQPDSAGTEDEGGTVPTKALAAVGAVLVLVGIGVVVKRLTGGEDPEVAIETPEDDENRPVGVTVDE